MRYIEINEGSWQSKDAELVEWPTNLAWKIEFKQFSALPSLLDFRQNALFLMPFRNWQNTFHSLTLKEATKVKSMQTSVFAIPDSALVGEMKIISRALSVRDPIEQADHIKEYQNSLIPYSIFKSNPFMFEQPEIMVERTLAILQQNTKVGIVDFDPTDNEYRIGIAIRK